MWFSPIVWRGAYFWGPFWPWAAIRLIFSILVIVGIGYLIYRLIRHPIAKAKEDPLDILKKRYARGEITEEEFKKMKKDLSS